jgi:Peptidase inhibitor family I36
MRRLKLTLTVAAMVITAATFMVTPASANEVNYSCPAGNVCFYTGFDGSGSRCRWGADDPDWQGGGVRCSWSGTTNVRSIWNNTSRAVDYYTSANHPNRDRIGCTHSGIAGNLAGTYKLRSHKFRSGSRC